MNTLKMIIKFLYQFLNDLLMLKRKGQDVKDAVLQTSHRLEKGLMRMNPKEMWGWDKAEYLAKMLSHCTDEFAYKVGSSVIQLYIQAKKNSIYSTDQIRAQKFEAKYFDAINKITPPKKNMVVI